MSVYAGPEIVNGGLVLSLDAGNARSYPGSGTTWIDVSNSRNNGTLTNGPTFDSNNGGSILFDGVNDTITSFPSLIVPETSMSVSCFFKQSDNIRMSLVSVRNNQSALGWFLVVNRSTVGNLSYGHAGSAGINAAEFAAGIINSVWYQAFVTYDIPSTTVTLYLNGKILGTPVSGFSPLLSAASFGNGAIGGADSQFSSPFNGNIANVQIYNRALSAAEVKQNFNALRGRFGI